VKRIADSIVEDWRAGSAYEKSFLGPAPEDPRYHTQKEVTLELFKSLTSGIELVRDQKLAKPLGATPEEAKPKLAAFWRRDTAGDMISRGAGLAFGFNAMDGD
jgi:predicted lipoprotein